jgi:Holliday junction resolvase RusA-like endonuclease
VRQVRDAHGCGRHRLFDMREDSGGQHMTLGFFVAGIPVPKGSMKSFPFRRKNGQLGVSTTNANPKTADWQQRIATQAQALNQVCWGGPVEIELSFHLPKPKYLSKKKYQGAVIRHTTKPDLDKLIRAAFDALTGILFRDDSQVCRIVATKKYVEDGAACGVHIYFAQEG